MKMRNPFLYILLIILVFNCKSEKKEVQSTSDETIEAKKDPLQQSKSFKFESKLLDVRGIKQEFNENLKVNKFGMQYVNDSIYAFVLNLDPSTLEETVSNYSFGVKGHYSESETPFKTTFSPEMTTIGNEKYVILRRKINKIKYFDSLDIYIYRRKNWKASGRLGSIKVKDILFENE